LDCFSGHWCYFFVFWLVDLSSDWPNLSALLFFVDFALFDERLLPPVPVKLPTAFAAAPIVSTTASFAPTITSHAVSVAFPRTVEDELFLVDFFLVSVDVFELSFFAGIIFSFEQQINLDFSAII
jgi:hypothetical protein